MGVIDEAMADAREPTDARPAADTTESDAPADPFLMEFDESRIKADAETTDQILSLLVVVSNLL